MEALIESLVASGPLGVLCAVLLFICGVLGTFCKKLLAKNQELHGQIFKLAVDKVAQDVKTTEVIQRLVHNTDQVLQLKVLQSNR